MAIKNGAIESQLGDNGYKVRVTCNEGAEANTDIEFHCAAGAWIAQSTNMMKMTFDWWSGEEDTFCGDIGMHT